MLPLPSRWNRIRLPGLSQRPARPHRGPRSRRSTSRPDTAGRIPRLDRNCIACHSRSQTNVRSRNCMRLLRYLARHPDSHCHAHCRGSRTWRRRTRTHCHGRSNLYGRSSLHQTVHGPRAPIPAGAGTGAAWVSFKGNEAKDRPLAVATARPDWVSPADGVRGATPAQTSASARTYVIA